MLINIVGGRQKVIPDSGLKALLQVSNNVFVRLFDVGITFSAHHIIRKFARMSKTVWWFSEPTMCSVP